MKSKLASATVTRRTTSSSGSEMEDEQPPTQASRQPSTSKATSEVPQPHSQDEPRVARPKPQKGKAKDVDKENDQLLIYVAKQQQETAQLHANIAREHSSHTAWGNWMGVMAKQIDDRLIPRFYRQSLDLMLAMVDESRQLQFRPPTPQQLAPTQPPPTQFAAPSASATFTQTDPPPQFQNLQPQQDQPWHPLVGRSTRSQPIVDWDTMPPTAAQPGLHPVRPSSTPNMSYNFPGLSDISLGNFTGLTPDPAAGGSSRASRGSLDTPRDEQ